MSIYEDMMAQLDSGNISKFHVEVISMSASELAHFAYWLHFSAMEYCNGILITRAYLHTKLAFEEIRKHG